MSWLLNVMLVALHSTTNVSVVGRWLKSLEEEIRKLKHILAKQALDIRALGMSWQKSGNALRSARLPAPGASYSGYRTDSWPDRNRA